MSISPKRSRAAFTLIELLIVVAIIAILAAIAVPNFLEAQVRSKVSRTKADMRAMTTAIEAYNLDTNHYPPDGNDLEVTDPLGGDFNVALRLKVLTTPISYLTLLPTDPFNLDKVAYDPANPFNPLPTLFPGDPPYTYIYNTLGTYTGTGDPSGVANFGSPDNWTLTSLGPSRTFDAVMAQTTIEYDPTNGTVSIGDINRSGGTFIH